MKKQVNQHIEKTNDLREPVLQSKQKTKVEKTFAGIFIALGILLLIFGGIIGLLHLKRVQTYIIGKVTNRLELLLNADIKIAQFHYRPLSHLPTI